MPRNNRNRRSTGGFFLCLGSPPPLKMKNNRYRTPKVCRMPPVRGRQVPRTGPEKNRLSFAKHQHTTGGL